MARVKGGTVARKRRKKILKLAKGYYGAKHLLFKTAKEQVMKSFMYAYRDRRQRKRDFRKLWISRISAAAKNHGTSYSKLMFGLKLAGIDVNRKMLSEVAIHDDKAFGEFVVLAKKAQETGAKKSVQETVKPKNVKTAEKATVVSTDLTKMTVAELKDLAKEKDVKIPSGLKKDEIIALLSK